MERARALAARLDAIVRDHATARGWSDEEFAERREVALYGRRRTVAAPVEDDPDEAHFVRSEVPAGYEEREKFFEEEARREAIRLRDMAAQEIRNAMGAFFAYRVIVHGDAAAIAAQGVRAAFYDGQAQDLGRALEWLTSAEYPEVLEGDQLTGVWEMLNRAEAIHEEYNGLVEAHLASRGDRGEAIERRRMETAALWAAAA
jgi:Cu2+-containing amine oxidase